MAYKYSYSPRTRSEPRKGRFARDPAPVKGGHATRTDVPAGRTFGRHEYLYRMFNGWPIYSPQNVRSRLLPKHLKTPRQKWWVW